MRIIKSNKFMYLHKVVTILYKLETFFFPPSFSVMNGQVGSLIAFCFVSYSRWIVERRKTYLSLRHSAARVEGDRTFTLSIAIKQIIMDEGIHGLPTNRSFNDTQQTDTFVFDDYIQRIIIAVLFVVICLVGIVGNSLVILAIVLSPKLKSTTNWFVLNLACSDLIACLFLPFHSLTMLDKTDRSLPEWLCTLISAVRLTCLSVSLIMLGLIGFTRWFLITKPLHKFKKLYRHRNIIILMISSWVYSAVWVIIPHFVGLGTLGFSVQFKVCQWDTSIVPFMDFYGLLGGFGVFVMFVVVVFNYALIYRFVVRHDRKMQAIRFENIRMANLPGTSSSDNTDGVTAEDQSTQISKHSPDEDCQPSSLQRNQRCRDKKKDRMISKETVIVTKRLAVIVFAFFFCFMPFGISILVTPLRPIVPWTFPVLYLSNCINPLIYARTMPSFREVMGSILRCRCGNM